MATHAITAGSTPEVTATLTANTVDTVTFPAGVATVTVFNRTGEAPINVRIDGEAPIVGGERWNVGEATIPGAKAKVTIPTRRWPAPTTVKLISSGAQEYTVCEGPNRMSGNDVEYL